MRQIKYLIVGGGIAGTTASQSIRQNDTDGSIAIISNEPHYLYSRTLLSKPVFFLDKIPAENIFIKKEDWYIQNKIDILKSVSAVDLNTEKQIVRLSNNDEIQYEKLLIAIGSDPVNLNIEGCNLSGIFYVRTLDDIQKIKAVVKTAKSVICVGGGLVGFEMCDVLAKLKIPTSIIFREPYFFGNILDAKAGAILESGLIKNNIQIINNSQIQKFTGINAVAGVITSHNQNIQGDLIIVGIGSQPQFSFINSKILNINKGIVVNEYLETNIPNVWAAGDCAENYHPVLNEHTQLGNWSNSQIQGRVVGQNMVGKKQPMLYISAYITTGLGVNLAFLGSIKPSDSKREIVKISSNAYIKLIVDDQRVLGAVLINNPQNISMVLKAIENKHMLTEEEVKL